VSLTALLTSNPQNAALQGVPRGVVGMKLEPIVDLSTLHTIGVEVLSLLAPPLQSEAWFQRLSAKQTLDLLQAQCEMLKNRLPWHNLFINLPITLLTEVDLFRLLLPLPGPGAARVQIPRSDKTPAPRQTAHEPAFRECRWFRPPE
jgi:hypothetical protein